MRSLQEGPDFQDVHWINLEKLRDLTSAQFSGLSSETHQ